MIVDLERLAREHAARSAIREARGATSFAELAERVRVRVRALSDRGLRAGSRVALVCPPGGDTAIEALALLELGCALLPLGPRSSEAERLALVESFGAEWVADAGGPKPAPGGGAARAPDAVDATPPALALPSSGSTGRPKLVLRSAEQVRAAMQIHARSVSLAAGDRVLALVPLEHAYGFGNVLLASLDAGACVVFPDSSHPRAVAALAEREQVALLATAPVFFDLCARTRGVAPDAFRRVRACISVGSALGVEVHRAFTSTFGAPLWQSYGASEAGPVCLNTGGEAEDGVLALGRPCPGVEVSLQDDAGRTLSEAETGEIVVRSPGVALGYAGVPDGASRIAGGRFFSGDLGRREGGLVFFAGRRKLLIATAGRKVDPLEVERVLLRHPDVVDAAVVAEPVSDSQDVVKAIVVARRPLDATALIGFCAQSLAPYKLPRRVEFRASLPRDALGKLARHRL
jgi:long-chain acyl-CoA synthetase